MHWLPHLAWESGHVAVHQVGILGWLMIVGAAYLVYGIWKVWKDKFERH
jgi:threonine/homoserine/homoserine lactone efflux protein